MVHPSTDPASSPQEVADFYKDLNILLTGASGFLGKLLTEKILRLIPNVKSLFLILRTKKGKSPETRLEELFNDVIFDRLKKENPEFARKIFLIEGDMGHTGLGLSPEHRELLRTTHVVLHGAASVRFNEPLRDAANINVRGTKELVSLATEMPDLKAFVHISTAYSNCVQELIEEKFYPPPIDATKLLNLTDILNDEALECLAPALLGKWPNTYAFSKAIAEDTIRHSSRALPLCVVRPSIIISTYKEPISGWTDNVYGPTGVAYGAALGLLHTLYCNKDLIADLIPADYVVNSIIVAAWDVDRTRSTHTNDKGTPTAPIAQECPIYNIVSSCQKPITWGQWMKFCEEGGSTVPSTMCLWYYFFTLNKHLWIHKIYAVFLHFLPAAVVDTVAWCIGREPNGGIWPRFILTLYHTVWTTRDAKRKATRLWKAYRKIHKFSSVISYFTMNQWRFHNDRVLRMWESLSSADRNRYDFDIAGLDWKDECYSIISGMRVYLAKDPLDTLPEGRAKYAKLKMAHYTLVTILFGIFVWFLWAFLRFFTS